MTQHACENCGKLNDGMHYCNWDCMVQYAKNHGGKEHLPNGLPIRSIKADGTMLEHEHGDHPDYKFPVTVENTCSGDIGTDLETIRETHALIYNDECIAVTMYECCYYMWYLKNGERRGFPDWDKRSKQVLNKESRDKIKGIQK